MVSKISFPIHSARLPLRNSTIPCTVAARKRQIFAPRLLSFGRTGIALYLSGPKTSRCIPTR